MRLFALALCLAAGTAAAGPADSLAIRQETFRLDNGLTVVVHEDHSVPLVSVNTWYHVGSRDEERGRTGFAHLFEHFFFNGSEHYPHGFREAMDDLGATTRNGTTNTDRTNFFEDVPVAALDRTLYLEADRMGFLAAQINDEMLTRERGVVQNEKRQGENQPYGRVYDRLVETMYPYSHPYSWSTIGSMADLDAASLADVRDWYTRWYAPNNAVLVLAGDITVARARELVQKYYGGIPAGAPVPRLSRWLPALDTDIRDTMQDRVPQARIYRAWHVPGWGEADAHALEVYAATLAGSDAAPLTRRLVFEKQLATDVSVEVATSEIAGVFIATASVKPGVDPAEVEREMDAVIADSLAKVAIALDRLGEFDAAIPLFQEAIRISPDTLNNSYLVLVRALILRERYSEALQVVPKALSRYSQNPDRTRRIQEFAQLAQAGAGPEGLKSAQTQRFLQEYIESARRSAGDHPKDSGALRRMALLHLWQGETNAYLDHHSAAAYLAMSRQWPILAEQSLHALRR